MQPHTLPPFPNGWYAVAFSEELAASKIISKRFMGREVVLFRTAKGEAALIDAYCPHMGAHFGHGGKVIDESIWCPFHGFQFNTAGKCVRTGYGTPPSPKCVVSTYPIMESHGVILAWFDTLGRAPHWEIPRLDTTGWGPLAWRQFQLNSHPQETSENSVDIGHFSTVHEYEKVGVLVDVKTEGHVLSARYTMSRKADFLMATKKLVRTEFDALVLGLGYSYVVAEVAQFGLQTRQWVFATPTDAGKVELRIAMSLRFTDSPRKVHPLLALLPRKQAMNILTAKAIQAYAHDVQQDFDVWQNKIYVHPPALARGDGPVIQYRKWCRQFYTEYEAAPVVEMQS